MRFEAADCAGGCDGWGLIEHFKAGGEMVAAQLPSRSNWSPEKKLAAAVLVSALVHVRNHHADRARHRVVQEDLTWILSDEACWPYSFMPLCHVLGLEPAYIRLMVRRWMSTPAPSARRTSSVHRSAG